MLDFDYDCYLKKQLARQASHRKRGSKSKKCSLSTDHMTQKQWKERCGEVVTYSLGKPMRWAEFKALPLYIQKEYLQSLIGRYHVNATNLSKMFGCSNAAVVKHCSKPEIDIRFSQFRGIRMSEEDFAAWQAFASPELTAGASPDASSEEPAKITVGEITAAEITAAPVSLGEVEPQLDLSKSKPAAMRMQNFSLSFRGEFSRAMLVNSISSMVPDGAQVSLKIDCEIL